MFFKSINDFLPTEHSTVGEFLNPKQRGNSKTWYRCMAARIFFDVFLVVNTMEERDDIRRKYFVPMQRYKCICLADLERSTLYNDSFLLIEDNVPLNILSYCKYNTITHEEFVDKILIVLSQMEPDSFTWRR